MLRNIVISNDPFGAYERIDGKVAEYYHLGCNAE
jgi:hypothetical protein